MKIHGCRRRRARARHHQEADVRTRRSTQIITRCPATAASPRTRCACRSGRRISTALVALCAATSSVDYAVVAPDDPLVLGAVDALTAAGMPCFGPNRSGGASSRARKVFSKQLMKKYGIPTAAYETFDDTDAALAYLDTRRPSRSSSRRTVSPWARASSSRRPGRRQRRLSTP